MRHKHTGTTAFKRDCVCALHMCKNVFQTVCLWKSGTPKGRLGNYLPSLVTVSHRCNDLCLAWVAKSQLGCVLFASFGLFCAPFHISFVVGRQELEYSHLTWNADWLNRPGLQQVTPLKCAPKVTPKKMLFISFSVESCSSLRMRR